MSALGVNSGTAKQKDRPKAASCLKKLSRRFSPKRRLESHRCCGPHSGDLRFVDTFGAALSLGAKPASRPVQNCSKSKSPERQKVT
jgi:hypothetical protein